MAVTRRMSRSMRLFFASLFSPALLFLSTFHTSVSFTWSPYLGRYSSLQNAASRVQLHSSFDDQENDDQRSKRDDDSESKTDLRGDPLNISVNTNRRPSIPLIGPIPMSPPLLVGDSMIVRFPTPMQWRTFDEALWIHRNSNASLVDASPIVAIIDDTTGKNPAKSIHGSGRYATIAAIMGTQQQLDQLDSEVLHSKGTVTSGSVRLYGIARAVLCDFYNRIPSSYTTLNADEEDEEDDEDSDEFYYDDDYHEDDDDESASRNNYLDRGIVPIIMAEFELLSDIDIPSVIETYSDTPAAGTPRDHASAWSANFWSSLTLSSKSMDNILASQHVEQHTNDDDYSIPSLSAYAYSNNYQRSKKIFDNLGDGFTSPAAAISKLARIGSQVVMMHDSRRSLVSGITAAKRRLQNYYSNEGKEQQDPKLLWNDITNEWEQDNSESVNIPVPKSQNAERRTTSWPSLLFQQAATGDVSIEEDERQQTFFRRITMRNGKRIIDMENYGLSYYGAFSSLLSLTEEAMQQFEPYYSPSHRYREEYKYEIQSFVAWKSLEGIVSKDDVAWSLLCTSTRERLLRAYDLMFEHRLGLEALADELSQELSSCGEECTDLW